MSRANPLQCFAEADPLRFAWMTQMALRRLKEEKLIQEIHEEGEMLKMAYVMSKFPAYRKLLEDRVPVCAEQPFDQKVCFAEMKKRADSVLDPVSYILNQSSLSDKESRALEEKLPLLSGADLAIVKVLQRLPLFQQRKLLALLNDMNRSYYASSPKKIELFKKCMEEAKRRDERLQMALVLDALAQRRAAGSSSQGVARDISSHGQVFL